jgi:hypothetical protein
MKRSPDDCVHLTVDIVREIHTETLEQFGGLDGIPDVPLNGVEPTADGPRWEDLVLAVAAGQIDRDETTARLRRILAGR